ncbi:MAG: hypothetical protein ACE5E1_08740, partial [Phycisphaerae bacterium]
VNVVLGEDISTEVKVWVVAERSVEDIESQAESETEVTHDAGGDAAVGARSEESVEPPRAEPTADESGD